MITLTEAFELRNKLANMITETECIFLYNRDDFIEATERHLKSKAYSEADDETKTKEPNKDFDFEPNELIQFYNYLNKEQIELIRKIEDSKIGNDFDLLLAENKSLRNQLKTLQNLKKIKPRKTYIRNGVGTKFNETGEQVTYSYDVEVEEKVLFDKEPINEIVKALREKTNANSTKISELQISTLVRYDSCLLNCSDLEEAYSAWKEVCN